MQRQSLGSPSSKLVKDEQLSCESQKQYASQSSSTSEEEEELKKLMRLKPKTAMPETYIHLIPMLTLLCFLILYLSSHDPSQNDLAEFSGLKTFSNPADSEDNISELQRVTNIKKADVLAVRSLKNLKQEADAAKHRRLHRKIAHF